MVAPKEIGAVKKKHNFVPNLKNNVHNLIKSFEKCNKMTEGMTPDELKAFEEEYKQCPSVKEYKGK